MQWLTWWEKLVTSLLSPSQVAEVTLHKRQHGAVGRDAGAGEIGFAEDDAVEILGKEDGGVESLDIGAVVGAGMLEVNFCRLPGGAEIVADETAD